MICWVFDCIYGRKHDLISLSLHPIYKGKKQDAWSTNLRFCAKTGRFCRLIHTYTRTHTHTHTHNFASGKYIISVIGFRPNPQFDLVAQKKKTLSAKSQVLQLLASIFGSWFNPHPFYRTPSSHSWIRSKFGYVSFCSKPLKLTVLRNLRVSALQFNSSKIHQMWHCGSCFSEKFSKNCVKHKAHWHKWSAPCVFLNLWLFCASLKRDVPLWKCQNLPLRSGQTSRFMMSWKGQPWESRNVSHAELSFWDQTFVNNSPFSGKCRSSPQQILPWCCHGRQECFVLSRCHHVLCWDGGHVQGTFSDQPSRVENMLCRQACSIVLLCC